MNLLHDDDDNYNVMLSVPHTERKNYKLLYYY